MFNLHTSIRRAISVSASVVSSVLTESQQMLYPLSIPLTQHLSEQLH